MLFLKLQIIVLVVQNVPERFLSESDFIVNKVLQNEYQQ